MIIHFMNRSDFFYHFFNYDMGSKFRIRNTQVFFQKILTEIFNLTNFSILIFYFQRNLNSHELVISIIDLFEFFISFTIFYLIIVYR